MSTLDRAIDNRTEDLLEEIKVMGAAIKSLEKRVMEDDPILPPSFPVNVDRVQRLFWEWRTLKEHKHYGCGAS